MMTVTGATALKILMTFPRYGKTKWSITLITTRISKSQVALRCWSGAMLTAQKQLSKNAKHAEPSSKMSHEQDPHELIQTSFGDVQEYARKHKEALETFMEELLLLKETQTLVNIRGYAGSFTNKIISVSGNSHMVKVPVGPIRGPRKPR